MKPLHVVRGLAGIALVAVCIGGTAYAQQGKIEVIGGPTIDWGTVSPQKLTKVIEVKNVGEGDLKVNEVRPSCGCTTTGIDKNLLKPGEIGKISVTFDVSARTGPVQKSVTINSSDSVVPYLVMTLKADVKRSLTLTPSNTFMIIDGEKGVELAASSVRIKNSGDEVFTVSAPKLVNGNIKARFDMTESKEVKPGEELEIKMFATPEDANSIWGTVQLESSNPEYAKIDLSIAGTMKKAQTSAQPQGTAQPVPSVGSHK